MRTRTVIAAFAVLTLTSCSTRNLDFVEDRRVSIHTPSDGQHLRLPLTLRWSAHDFDGKFAVFIDDARPMRPGQTLLSLVTHDDPCRRTAVCPSDEWLARRNVYVTQQQTLLIEHLAERGGQQAKGGTHDVVIVLLDRSGRRSSEATFHREFVVEQERS